LLLLLFHVPREGEVRGWVHVQVAQVQVQRWVQTQKQAVQKVVPPTMKWWKGRTSLLKAVKTSRWRMEMKMEMKTGTGKVDREKTDG